MNLPNKLTMMRVVLVPVFMVFAALAKYGTADFNATFSLVAGIIFTVASITDFLDGYIARKNHLVTDFGKFMDPLADKCLTTAAFIYMVADGICSPVVLAVILFREFAVAGVRMIAAESGTVIAANMWGKVKTVLQMLTIIFYYFAAALAALPMWAWCLVTVVLSGWRPRPRCCLAVSTCGRTASCLCRRSNTFAAAGADARIDPHNRERLNPTIKELLFCKNQHSKQNCIIFTAG